MRTRRFLVSLALASTLFASLTGAAAAAAGERATCIGKAYSTYASSGGAVGPTTSAYARTGIAGTWTSAAASTNCGTR